MKMVKIKWTRKEPTLIAPMPSGQKVEVKGGATVEVDESVAIAVTNAYADWVMVDGSVKKTKKKVSKKPEVETQDVKKEDVEEA